MNYFFRILKLSFCRLFCKFYIIEETPDATIYGFYYMHKEIRVFFTKLNDTHYHMSFGVLKSSTIKYPIGKDGMYEVCLIYRIGVISEEFIKAKKAEIICYNYLKDGFSFLYYKYGRLLNFQFSKGIIINNIIYTTLYTNETDSSIDYSKQINNIPTFINNLETYEL